MKNIYKILKMFKIIFNIQKKRLLFFRFLKSPQLFHQEMFKFCINSSNTTISTPEGGKPSLNNQSPSLNSQINVEELQKTLSHFEENIKNLKMSSTIELNLKDLCGNNVLASTKVLPDLKNIINNAKVFVTPEREDFIFKMINFLRNSLSEKPYEKRHILTGPSGIGKTFTLFLLVSELKKFNKNIKVVYIPNCYHLMDNGWKAIIKEFIFTFPEKEKELKKFLEGRIEKDAINAMYDIINQEKHMTILIMDQINFILDNETYSLFKSLSFFPWNLQIFSQSANNDPQKALKFFLFHSFDKLMSIEQIRDQIENNPKFQKLKHSKTGIKDLEEKKLDLEERESRQSLNEYEALELQDLKNVEKIMARVGSNPREMDRIFENSGNNIDETIAKYEQKRVFEILLAHEKFQREFLTNQAFIIRFAKAVFFMDKEINLTDFLIIDHKLMIRKYVDDEGNYQIKSNFPLAGKILKNIFHAQITAIEKNFFAQRIEELHLLMRKISFNDSCRGHFFESLVMTSFEKAHQLKEEISLLGSTGSYLDKTVTKEGKIKVPYEVHIILINYTLKHIK